MYRLKDAIETHGWGLYAVELKTTGEFIGFISLCIHLPKFEHLWISTKFISTPPNFKNPTFARSHLNDS